MWAEEPQVPFAVAGRFDREDRKLRLSVLRLQSRSRYRRLEWSRKAPATSIRMAIYGIYCIALWLFGCCSISLPHNGQSLSARQCRKRAAPVNGHRACLSQVRRQSFQELHTGWVLRLPLLTGEIPAFWFFFLSAFFFSSSLFFLHVSNRFSTRV